MKTEALKFYVCAKCGNIVQLIKASGVPVFCCGEEMKELTPNTVDASHEKHVPVVTRTGSALHVAIGAAPHPMEEKHWIEWIYVETCCGTYRKTLKPGDAPEATFALGEGEEVRGVYAYCNIHGLWAATL